MANFVKLSDRTEVAKPVKPYKSERGWVLACGNEVLKQDDPCPQHGFDC